MVVLGNIAFESQAQRFWGVLRLRARRNGFGGIAPRGATGRTPQKSQKSDFDDSKTVKHIKLLAFQQCSNRRNPIHIKKIMTSSYFGMASNIRVTQIRQTVGLQSGPQSCSFFSFFMFVSMFFLFFKFGTT